MLFYVWRIGSMGEVEKRIDTALRQAVSQRNYRRVRDRALTRLANLYPDQYRDLLEEERARDEQAQKVWLDITGRTGAGLGAPATSNRSEVAEGLSNQSTPRHLGGEG